MPKILPESWLQLIGCETNVRQKNKSETKNKKEIPELEDGNEKESETESDKGSDEGSEKKDKDDEDEL